MRAFAIAFVAGLVVAGPVLARGDYDPPLSGRATVGSGLPEFRRGTPYPAVRAKLVRLGFRPLKILNRDPGASVECIDEPDGSCRKWPENTDCSSGIGYCTFLFQRPVPARGWIEVQTVFGAVGVLDVLMPARASVYKEFKAVPIGPSRP